MWLVVSVYQLLVSGESDTLWHTRQPRNHNTRAEKRRFLWREGPAGVGSSQACTLVSQKSTHCRSTLPVCQRGGWALFRVFTLFNHKKAPMSCLHQFDALEANNWTNSNAQWSHQRIWSRVLMTHNTLNSTTSVHHCEHGVARCVCHISYVRYPKPPRNIPSVKCKTKFLALCIVLYAVLLKLHECTPLATPEWAQESVCIMCSSSPRNYIVYQW